MNKTLEEIGHHLVIEAAKHPKEALATIGTVTTIAAPVVIPIAIGGAIGYGLGVLVDALISKDKIYILNKTDKTMYVAIHNKSEQKWATSFWFKIPSDEKVCILSERLDDKYIYCHSHTLDGSYYWGKGDYEETLDDLLYKFSMFDTGTSRSNFTISYSIT